MSEYCNDSRANEFLKSGNKKKLEKYVKHKNK